MRAAPKKPAQDAEYAAVQGLIESLIDGIPLTPDQRQIIEAMTERRPKLSPDDELAARARHYGELLLHLAELLERGEGGRRIQTDQRAETTLTRREQTRQMVEALDGVAARKRYGKDAAFADAVASDARALLIEVYRRARRMKGKLTGQPDDVIQHFALLFDDNFTSSQRRPDAVTIVPGERRLPPKIMKAAGEPSRLRRLLKGESTPRELADEVLRLKAGLTTRQLRELARRPVAPQDDAPQDDADWLRRQLQAGPVAFVELQRRAQERGISERTLYRLRDKIGARHKRQGFGKPVAWYLPSPDVVSRP